MMEIVNFVIGDRDKERKRRREAEDAQRRHRMLEQSSRVTKSTLPVTDDESSEKLAEVVNMLTGDDVVVRRDAGAYVARTRGVSRRTKRRASIQPGLPGEVIAHEVMHILESPEDLPRQIADNSFNHFVWNGLEDARIDRRGTKKYGRDIIGVHKEMLDNPLKDDFSDIEFRALFHRSARDYALAQMINGTGTAICQAAFGLDWSIDPSLPSADKLSALVLALTPKILEATSETATKKDVVTTTIVVVDAIRSLIGSIDTDTDWDKEQPEYAEDPVEKGGGHDDDGDEETDEDTPEPDDEGEDAGGDGEQRGDGPSEDDDDDEGSGGDGTVKKNATREDKDATENDEPDKFSDRRGGRDDADNVEPENEGATEAHRESIRNTKTNPTAKDNSDLALKEHAAEIKDLLAASEQNTKTVVRNAKSTMTRNENKRAEQDGRSLANRARGASERVATKAGVDLKDEYKNITTAYQASDHHGVALAAWPLKPITVVAPAIDAAVSGIGRDTESYADYSGALAADHWRVVVGNLKVYERERTTAPRIVVLVDNSGSMGYGAGSTAELAWGVVKSITDFAPLAEVFAFQSGHLASAIDVTQVGNNHTNTTITPVPHGTMVAHSGATNADCVALLWLEHYVKTTGDINSTVAIVISDGTPASSTPTCTCYTHTSQISHRLAAEGMRYASILLGGVGSRYEEEALYPSEVSVDLPYEMRGVTQAHADGIRHLLERGSAS